MEKNCKDFDEIIPKTICSRNYDAFIFVIITFLESVK